MSFGSSSPNFFQYPGSQPLINELTNLANSYDTAMERNPTLQANRSIVKQMEAGNYGGLAGTLLAPIEQQAQTNIGTAERANALGGNAFMSGYQPALMSSLNNLAVQQGNQAEGQALSSAIPSLFSNASNTVLSGTEALDQLKQQALQAALTGNIGSYVTTTNPSGLSQLAGGLGILSGVGQLGQTASQLGAPF